VGTDAGTDLDTADSDVTFCARHPRVETVLRCGRCDTPICPRCLVQTPVGARCPDCANVRRLPTIDVTPIYLARGVAASLVAGAVTGAFWGFLSSGRGINFVGFFLIFLAMGIGYCVAEAVSLSTNHKRARTLQYIAGGGVIFAYFVHSVVAYGVLIPQNDLWGMLAAGFGAFWAAQRVANS
jgi:hypothetical protein